MIVGSAPALRRLGHQLIDVKESPPRPDANPWPRMVCQPMTQGPYTDRPEFIVSFHVKEAPLPPDLRPTRRDLPALIWVAIAACAFLGATDVIRWISDVL